jgi:hypothetical protein
LASTLRTPEAIRALQQSLGESLKRMKTGRPGDLLLPDDYYELWTEAQEREAWARAYPNDPYPESGCEIELDDRIGTNYSRLRRTLARKVKAGRSDAPTAK